MGDSNWLCTACSVTEPRACCAHGPGLGYLRTIYQVRRALHAETQISGRGRNGSTSAQLTLLSSTSVSVRAMEGPGGARQHWCIALMHAVAANACVKVRQDMPCSIQYDEHLDVPTPTV